MNWQDKIDKQHTGQTGFFKQIEEEQLKQNKMLNENLKPTGEKVKFENGKVFSIYSKNTKKGVRYYIYSRMQMRAFPISQFDINKYILLEN